jgi:thimet oligopeptidase
MRRTISLRLLSSVLGVLVVTPGLGGSPAHAQPATTEWKLQWKWTPDQIHGAGQRVMTEADRRYDAIANMKDAERTFDNTIRGMEQVGTWAGEEIGPPLFLKYVSTDEKIRDAGDSLEVVFSRWAIKTQAREDLYAALKAAVKKDPPKTAIEKRLVEKMTLDFQLNGLDLPKEKRDRVTELKQKISDLGIAFDTNLNEAQDSLLLTREELVGMPDSYVERLEKAKDGRYKVTVSYPDFYPFMQNSTNATARAELERKFSNRASDKNLKLLAEALVLRQQLAETMGKKNYAEYALQDRMAKSPAQVMGFLTDLVAKLKPYRDQDIATLSALKKEKEGADAGPVTIADWRFYDNELKKTRYQVNPEEVREYFPLDVVTEGLMNTYQTLFGLKFKEIKPADAWHEDVQLFEVRDAKDDHLVGHFYLDLFPRPNKYGHAAAWGLVKGHMEDGKWVTPVSAMVCNFTKPTATDPSLLGHDEVETFFHEFGHVMHNINGKTPIGYFSGTSVYQDFVEAPSQMLENWVWDADVLQSLSGHYKDKSKKLPRELLDRMILAKNLDNGLKYSRQAFFALTDMRYHSEPVKSTTDVWHEGMRDVFGIPASAGTFEEGSFGHLFGYEAGYYSYLWAEVFAADMFSRFKKDGVMNPETGRAYRDLILAPGGSKEPMELLEAFLGRKPNQEAFLEHIGVKPPVKADAGAVGTD